MYYMNNLKVETNKLSTTVTANWLNENSGNKNLIVLDASIKPVTKSIGEIVSNEFIPNSRKFDLKMVFSDPTSAYDHTLPKFDQMIENIQKLGITRESKIVVYDNQGIYSSPRVFFMLQSLGFANTAILDGGLTAWKNRGYYTVESYSEEEVVGGFSINNSIEDYRFFCDSAYVLDRLDEAVIIDVRSNGRFYGTEVEPRENMKSGHIPNSINIPFECFLENGKLKTSDKLKAIFSGIDSSKELIFSCGSGVTSCIGALAARSIGCDKIKIYDGSWAEWGNVENSFPIEL